MQTAVVRHGCSDSKPHVAPAPQQHARSRCSFRQHRFDDDLCVCEYTHASYTHTVVLCGTWHVLPWPRNYKFATSSLAPLYAYGPGGIDNTAAVAAAPTGSTAGAFARTFTSPLWRHYVDFLPIITSAEHQWKAQSDTLGQFRQGVVLLHSLLNACQHVDVTTYCSAVRARRRERHSRPASTSLPE